eukprot:432683_1
MFVLRPGERTSAVFSRTNPPCPSEPALCDTRFGDAEVEEERARSEGAVRTGRIGDRPLASDPLVDSGDRAADWWWRPESGNGTTALTGANSPRVGGVEKY